jgi:hypothetical protein
MINKVILHDIIGSVKQNYIFFFFPPFLEETGESTGAEISFIETNEKENKETNTFLLLRISDRCKQTSRKADRYSDRQSIRTVTMY